MVKHRKLSLLLALNVVFSTFSFSSSYVDQASFTLFRRFSTFSSSNFFRKPLVQTRYVCGSLSGRYMNLPTTPEWMFSRNQSSEETSIKLDDLSSQRSWVQHYNPVDDVLYYQIEPDDSSGNRDEVHVSQNIIEKVKARGDGLVGNILPYCSTGRIKSVFSLNTIKIVGTDSSCY